MHFIPIAVVVLWFWLWSSLVYQLSVSTKPPVLSFKVGVTTEDIDKVVHQAAILFGAYPSPLNYKEFPKSVCTSVNNVAVHGVPDR